MQVTKALWEVTILHITNLRIVSAKDLGGGTRLANMYWWKDCGRLSWRYREKRLESDTIWDH